MMPHSRKGRQGECEDNPQDQREASQGVVSECPVPVAEEKKDGKKEEEEDEEEMAIDSSSSTAMIPATPRSVLPTGVPSCPQSPLRASSPPIDLVSITQNQVNQGSRSRVAERLFPRGGLVDPESLLTNSIPLVLFLLSKYGMKVVTTKAEMLDVIKNHHNYFSMILRRAADCLQLIFGIDVNEVDPINHSYVLVTSLGLTYDGLQSDVQGLPKTGLLIMILCLIFMKGNCISEEEVWDSLNKMGVWSDREHYLSGNPRKLITEDFVQEQYLEYRQVPNSDPARYEFLWGPRAHLETSKMKILKHWAKFSGCDPSSFPALYKEALREEEDAL
ncbi:melanoma-associated antigen 10-like [Perognathus longimembris pacificus]|uniref:melanoma-associated antigen 10-like n=1 Tax=Perognathus longimembris pacificus TaxID=214514 RepID=UPI002018F6B8|nr:melanoma-associated antigen 10-like [Perognathus longimembris pacificus]